MISKTAKIDYDDKLLRVLGIEYHFHPGRLQPYTIWVDGSVLRFATEDTIDWELSQAVYVERRKKRPRLDRI